MAREMLLQLLVLLLCKLWEGALSEDPDYSINVQVSVTVQKGLCVFVPCTFTYPQYYWTDSEPTYGYWHKIETRKEVMRATNNPSKIMEVQAWKRFQLLGNPWSYNCSLSITDVHMEDTGDYVFRVERGHYMKYTYTRRLHLEVTDLTQTPEIKPVELVSGRPGNLICTAPWACKRGTPPSFFWSGAAINLQVPKISSNSMLTLIPQPQDHKTSLTCQVTLPGASVTVKKTIQINVSYPPQSVNISASLENGAGWKTLKNGTFLPVLEGHSLVLVCRADSNPTSMLSWTLGGKFLKTSQFSEPGVLNLSQVEVDYEGELTCLARNILGSQHVSLKLCVYRRPSWCCSLSVGQKGSWPLVFTLMGAGFLLTFDSIWIYYNK